MKVAKGVKLNLSKTGTYTVYGSLEDMKLANPDALTVKQTVRVVSKEKGAYWVTVDGRQIPRYIVRDNWEDAEEGWYYELADRTILMKCNKPQAKDFEIVVSTEKFDLIGMNED